MKFQPHRKLWLSIMAVVALGVGVGSGPLTNGHSSTSPAVSVTLSETDWARQLAISSYSSSEQDQRIKAAITATQQVPSEEPPKAGAGVVNAAPTGPGGSWSFAYGDGFTRPIGVGEGNDNTFYPNRGGTNPLELRAGDNSNELQKYSSSQVIVGADGLRLRAAYSKNVGGTGKDYVSGTVRTVNSANPSGYKLFKWKPTAGEAVALEVVWQWPRNSGEMNPAFWSTDSEWKAELDHPEGWGWPTALGGANDYQAGIPVWIFATPGSSTRHESYSLRKDLGYDITAGLHRWTTVYNTDGSQDFYSDGVKKWHVNPPSGTVNRPWMGIILQTALRRPSAASYTTAPNFTSGSRDTLVRSVAVYVDSAHAGQGILNGGVAPGTEVR